MNVTTSILLFVLSLLVGVVLGWCMRYLYDEILDRLYQEPHPFDNMFESNPHPELFDNNGNLYRGDYIAANFDENPWANEEFNDEFIDDNQF